MSARGTLINTPYFRGVRVMRGYTAKRSAKELGMSYSCFRNKEAGITAFTDEEKIGAAKLYGMTFEEFNKAFFGGGLPIG